MASAPAVPGTMSSMRAPNTTRMPMAVMMPRGMSRLGFADSSAASGTPSTARKNQMPKTRLPRRPGMPNGRKVEAPAAAVGAMSKRFAVSMCPIMPKTKARRATTAIAVMTNMRRSASPTPQMWMPTKTR